MAAAATPTPTPVADMGAAVAPAAPAADPARADRPALSDRPRGVGHVDRLLRDHRLRAGAPRHRPDRFAARRGHLHGCARAQPEPPLHPVDADDRAAVDRAVCGIGRSATCVLRRGRSAATLERVVAGVKGGAAGGGA